MKRKNSIIIFYLVVFALLFIPPRIKITTKIPNMEICSNLTVFNIDILEVSNDSRGRNNTQD
jgi:hypothetical protein